jgi:hypothetical protein
MPHGWTLAPSPSLSRAIGEGWIYQNWTIWFGKLDTPVFPYCAPARSSSNRVGEPRHGSMVILSKILLCLRFNWKVHQHQLQPPLLIPLWFSPLLKRSPVDILPTTNCHHRCATILLPLRPRRAPKWHHSFVLVFPCWSWCPLTSLNVCMHPLRWPSHH